DIPSLQYVYEYNRFKLNDPQNLEETLRKVLNNVYTEDIVKYYEQIKLEYNTDLIIQQHRAQMREKH
ncbi:hypothetical protein, partial [Sulfuricurvum sp.]|uniref:hypothetical protein n=1 Tax=Sulfuricurvum sp. TaxID=2025608 RepID=UPI003BB66AA2